MTLLPPSYRYLEAGEFIDDLDEYVPYQWTAEWRYTPVDESMVGKTLLECNVPYYRRFNHYFIPRKETFNEVFHNAILWAPRTDPRQYDGALYGTVRVPGNNW